MTSPSIQAFGWQTYSLPGGYEGSSRNAIRPRGWPLNTIIGRRREPSAVTATATVTLIVDDDALRMFTRLAPTLSIVRRGSIEKKTAVWSIFTIRRLSIPARRGIMDAINISAMRCSSAGCFGDACEHTRIVRWCFFKKRRSVASRAHLDFSPNSGYS